MVFLLTMSIDTTYIARRESLRSALVRLPLTLVDDFRRFTRPKKHRLIRKFTDKSIIQFCTEFVVLPLQE